MTETAAPKTDNTRMILHVAWMAILLGVGMQVLLLVFSGFPGLANFIAEMTQKIAWATIVCVGVAVGTAAARSMPAAAGIAGLIAAPVSFIIAKTLHKSLAQAIGAASPPDMTIALIIALVIIKAVEYGLFGYWLSRLVKLQARYNRFALAGMIAGIATAGLFFAALACWSLKLPQTGKLAAQLTNEVIFPIGCATVLFAATFFATKTRPIANA